MSCALCVCMCVCVRMCVCECCVCACAFVFVCVFVCALAREWVWVLRVGVRVRAGYLCTPHKRVGGVVHVHPAEALVEAAAEFDLSAAHVHTEELVQVWPRVPAWQRDN